MWKRRADVVPSAVATLFASLTDAPYHGDSIITNHHFVLQSFACHEHIALSYASAQVK